MFHNTKDAFDDWLPCTYSLNDWIIMKEFAKGPHRLPKNKRCDLLHEWKGCILKFTLGKKEWLAKVRHVYMAKDMLFHVSTNQRQIPLHCKFVF